MIVEVLRTMGYTANISKNIFNPIGAPHTWGNCLQLMEWISELAHTNHELNNDGDIDNRDTFEDAIIQGFKEDSFRFVETHLDRDIREAEQELKNLFYEQETNIMAIENLNSSQDDITTMDSKEEVLRSVLFREEQLVIHIDQESEKQRRHIEDLDKNDAAKANEQRVLEHTL